MEIGLFPALVLGAVQGVTEFLPVSSDGHLAIAAMLFGETEMSLAMVVLLHVGTLLATLIILREDVRPLVRTLFTPSKWRGTEEGAALRTILITSIPTAIVGLALHDAVEPLARSAVVVGICLWGSALAVASTRWTAPKATKTSLDLSVSHCVIIGIAQGLAVLPGLSRSGTSIATMMLLGLSGPTSFRLSFLLSLPAIAGAAILELRHPEVWSSLGTPAIAATVVAFVVGLAALSALRHIVAQGRFWAFAIYLVPLGAVLVVMGLYR